VKQNEARDRIDVLRCVLQGCRIGSDEWHAGAAALCRRLSRLQVVEEREEVDDFFERQVVQQAVGHRGRAERD
jgi:hypothetical protein